MTIQTQNILSTFDALPEIAKYEVTLEILRRTKDFDFPPLTDDALLANAESVFLALEQEELKDEHSKAR
jgi:hypothetical protein